MNIRLLEIQTREPILIKDIQIRYATVGIVRSGIKTVIHAADNEKWPAGTLFCFDRLSRWQLGQQSGLDHCYRAELLLLDTEVLDAFIQYTPLIANHTRSHCFHTRADKEIEVLWRRLQEEGISHTIRRHRIFELLLHLQTLGWQFSIAHHLSTTSQVEQLIGSKLDYPWTLTETAKALSMSSSTLQRRLRKEGIHFAEILRHLRMDNALYLLMSSKHPVGTIAQACGYLSAGKFTAAFKQHFGFKPSKVK